MSGWLLVVWLAYAGNIQTGGGVALNNMTKDFWSEAECNAARQIQISEFKNAGFARYSVSCLKRSGPLLDQDPVPAFLEKKMEPKK